MKDIDNSFPFLKDLDEDKEYVAMCSLDFMDVEQGDILINCHVEYAEGLDTKFGYGGRIYFVHKKTGRELSTVYKWFFAKRDMYDELTETKDKVEHMINKLKNQKNELSRLMAVYPSEYTR